MRNFRAALIILSIGWTPCALLAQAISPAQAKDQPRARGASSKAVSSPAESSGEIKAVTQAIVDEIDKHSELMANIEYLCDMIGPRLTGSPNLAQANRWTRDKFQQYGLTNAHLEPWTIEKAWTRGNAKGRVVLPVEQRLLVESAGWCPFDQRAAARTGGPRQSSVQGRAQPLQGQAERSLGPFLRSFGPTVT